MKNKIILLAIFVCSSILMQAQQIIPMDTAVRYGKLDNGLTYYIRYNNHPEKRADFYLVQNVGAILEEDNQKGLAHFLEHMAFNGTKNFPGKTLTNYMESIGAKFGANVNASTSLEKTEYKLMKIPVSRQSVVDSSILILHDWSGFISLTDDEINKERGVILEEWRTRASAGRRMNKESSELIYQGSPYANHDVIGDTAIIQHFKPEELRLFYKKWHRPDLQAIIIVGDIDIDKVEQSIKRMFADIQKPENPAQRIKYTIPENKEPIVSIVTDPEAQMATFKLLYKHKPLADSIKITEEALNIGLANSLISSMISDRFTQIKAEGSSPIILGYGAYSSLVPSSDAFQMSVVAKVGKEEPAFELLLKELERIKRYGFTQSELDRAIVKKISSIEQIYKERNIKANDYYINEYSRNFLEKEPTPGISWEYNYAVKALDEKINLEKINKVAQAYFTKTNIIVDIKAPKNASLLTKDEVLKTLLDTQNSSIEAYVDKTVNEPLLKNIPQSGSIVNEEKDKAFKTTKWTLSNGVRVILRPKKSNKDEVLFTAFSQGGLSLIKKEKDLPSAKFAAQIMDNNGLGEFTLWDLNRLLAGKRVSMKSYINNYGEGLNGSSNKQNLETLFQLAYLEFTAPRKDDVAYTNLIESLQTSLANSDKSPNKAFNDTISLVESNYNSREVLINKDIIKKLNQDKAYDIYKQRFANPADFTFVLVGPFDIDSIKPFILTYLGGLKTTKEKETWKDNNVRHPKGEIVKHFEQPMQVEKTSVNLSYWGELPYSIINKVNLDALSDVLKIRCRESIREDKGGTYSIGVSGKVSNKPISQGTLSIRFDTNKEKADTLIAIAQAELEKIQKEGVQTSDLDKVKAAMLKRYEENSKGKSWWVTVIKTYEEEGINLQTDYEKAINNLTSESIQQTLIALLAQKNKIEFKMDPKKDTN